MIDVAYRTSDLRPGDTVFQAVAGPEPHVRALLVVGNLPATVRHYGLTVRVRELTGVDKKSGRIVRWTAPGPLWRNAVRPLPPAPDPVPDAALAT